MAGSAVTRRCSASRWRGCTGWRTGWCGPTPARAGPASPRWPRVWPRPFRTLTTSCRVTASPPSSSSPASYAAPSAGRCWSMRDVLPQLRAWWEAGTPFALATVVSIRGSAPRPAGASMAVSATGEAVGSVSGGCVEGAVYELATEVLGSGEPQLESYGISDDEAFSVGLTCGGTIDVLVRRVDSASPIAQVVDALGRHEPVAVATVTGGAAPLGAERCVWPDRVVGSLGDGGLDTAVSDDARGLLAQGRT